MTNCSASGPELNLFITLGYFCWGSAVGYISADN